MRLLLHSHLNADNEQGIFDAVLRGHIDFSSDPWPSISTGAKELVKKMLRADPKERLSAIEILSKLHALRTAVKAVKPIVFICVCVFVN